MFRSENIYIEDEEIKELQSILKSMFTNIFVFIICIFLFFNPFLLTNFLLFISIFFLIKTIVSYLFPEQPLQQQLPLSKKDEDTKLISRLLKQNKILKNKINNLEKDEKTFSFSNRKKFKSSHPFNLKTEPLIFNFKLKEVTDFAVKEDVKEDIKENIKEDIKENIKEDIKEDVKEDVKEEFEEIKEEIDYEDDFEDDSYSILEKEKIDETL